MMSQGTGMTLEKIDRIYYCADCGTVFLFKSDASDHQDMTGHSNLNEMRFD